MSDDIQIIVEVGPQGPAGQGVPAGGTTGQVLAKIDGTDYNTEWVTGGGGGASDSFKTIAVSGQSNVVADSATDTLTLVAGSNVTITTNASTDEITINASVPSTPNVFGTIAVSGQSDVVADSSTDTLNLAAGSNVTITTNASTDTVTIAASQPNVFGTIAVSGQSNVVADSSNDTLTLVAGTNVTITTDASTDSITINASGGGGASDSFKTISIAGQSDVVADSSTDTLTLVAGTNITMTTNASTDTITINGPTLPNVFGTIQVSGQSDVVADSSTDTLTLAAGSNVTITTNASTDTVTIAASQPNVFGTIQVSGQSDVVADSSTDTLTLVAGTNMSITTNASTDTITLNSTIPSFLSTAWIPAAAIRPSASGGCAALALSATSANQPDLSSLDFDSTTAEYAQFAVRFPKSWNNGTVAAAFHWTHGSTTTNFGVRWGLQGVAASDGDAIAAAYGTAQEVTDTGGTTNTLYISPTTSAITIAGTPATGDQIFFRVYRDPANAGDTMAVDAKLIGVALFFTQTGLDDT